MNLEILVKIGADIAALNKTMADAQGSVNQAAKGIEGSIGVIKTAFIGLAGIGSIAAFAGMVKSSIDATAALQDLSIQTGASVAALGAFKSVGAYTETSTESIAGAMNRLTKAMSTSTEESKGTAQALKAIGISFDDFRKLGPDEQMLAAAKAMNNFADGSGKTAVAMALFGKEGAKMLPFLKDLGEQADEINAKLTEQEKALRANQAAMADAFGDNLTKIRKDSEAWKKDISTGMLPALYEASQAFLDVANGAGGLKEEISRLSKDGTIAEWVRGGITAITYLMDAFEGLGRIAKAIGVLIGGYFAGLAAQWEGLFEGIKKGLSLDFAGAADALRGGLAKSTEIFKEVGGDIANIFSAESMGAKLRARMEDLKGVSAAAKDARPAVDAALGGDKDKIADAQAKAYKDLIATIHEKIAANKLEEASGKKLTEAQQLELNIKKMVEKGTISAAQANSTLTKELLAQAAATEKNKNAKIAEEAANKAAAEAHWKYLESVDASTKKLQDETYGIEEQTQRIGLSKVAVAELDRAKLELMATEAERAAIRALDKNNDEAEYNALMKQAKAYRELGNAKLVNAQTTQDVEQFKSLWDSVDKAAESTFTNIFEGGQNAFTKLADTLKSTLLSLLYQMTVRRWVFDIAANLSGASGAALSAVEGGASGGGGLLSNLGSIGSMFGSGGLAGAISGGAGWLTGATSFSGALGAAGSLIGTGTGAGIMSGLGMGIGALGPVALGAMALSSLASGPTFKPMGGGITATLNSTGTTTGQVGRYDLTQETGRGGTTMNGAWSVADQGTTDYIINGVRAMTAANKDYAHAIGLSTEALDGYTKSIDINTTGMDAAATKAAINAELVKYSNEQISAAYGDTLASMAKSGESASQTLARVASEYIGLRDGLNALPLANLHDLGFKAAEGLIAASGGLDKLTGNLKTFVDQYYSADEKSLIGAGQVNKALSSVGIDTSMLMTKDDFRQLVESIDVSTAKGQEQVATLLAMSGEFASVADYLRQNNVSLSEAAQKSAETLGAVDRLSAPQQVTADQVTAVATNVAQSNTLLTGITAAVQAGASATVSALSGLANGVQAIAGAATSAAQAAAGAASAATDTAKATNNVASGLALAGSAPNYSYRLAGDMGA